MTPATNRRAPRGSFDTMPPGLSHVTPRIDLPTTLSQWLGRWTQGMPARVLFDSDLDPRLAPRDVMSVLKDGACHVFVWITEGGDVYGLLAPDIETYWLARKERLFRGFVFQTRTSAARIVPVRWFPSGDSARTVSLIIHNHEPCNTLSRNTVHVCLCEESPGMYHAAPLVSVPIFVRPDKPMSGPLPPTIPRLTCDGMSPDEETALRTLSTSPIVRALVVQYSD